MVFRNNNTGQKCLKIVCVLDVDMMEYSPCLSQICVSLIFSRMTVLVHSYGYGCRVVVVVLVVVVILI